LIEFLCQEREILSCQGKFDGHIESGVHGFSILLAGFPGGHFFYYTYGFLIQQGMYPSEDFNVGDFTVDTDKKR
jgi:hypothetical protein